MPPKQRINREMILERAFEMFLAEGMEVVNARSVAKALGCSTQPIFSYYIGMQDLRDALNLKARELFAHEVLQASREGNWLVNLCDAFVNFACSCPHVYRHLYETACRDREVVEALNPIGEEIAKDLCSKEGVSEEKAQSICRSMVVYAVGMAAVAMVGLYHGSELRAKLEKAYADVLSVAK